MALSGKANMSAYNLIAFLASDDASYSAGGTLILDGEAAH
jgi:NAD(P)-dependent dehydrogenase (short-subunit alcohol dehydrogenase family)